jgi:hypothetical protein
MKELIIVAVGVLILALILALYVRRFAKNKAVTDNPYLSDLRKQLEQAEENHKDMLVGTERYKAMANFIHLLKERIKTEERKHGKG